MIKIKILGERDMNQGGELGKAMPDRGEAVGMEEAEKLHGGAGDNMPDSDFDQQQLKAGVEDETGEHTADKGISKEIAKDHLAKDPEYYIKLKAAGLDEGKNYNHKQFTAWLNSEIKKETESDDRLLVEAKLSKYWKKRAARRAKNAERPWPNKTDRDWALGEQLKSETINNTIHKLFEKELEESEEMVDDISGMMRKIKSKRKEMKMKRETKQAMMKPQDKIKNKKSLSKPYPPHKKGETVGGYYRKASKKLGGAGVAPGESFGPGGALEEQKNPELEVDFGKDS